MRDALAVPGGRRLVVDLWKKPDDDAGAGVLA
jgi:hypothetical protein